MNKTFNKKLKGTYLLLIKKPNLLNSNPEDPNYCSCTTHFTVSN